MEGAKELIVRRVYQYEYIGLKENDYRVNKCSLVEYLSEDQLAEKRGLENLYLNQYNTMKEMLETQSRAKERIKQQLLCERSKNENLNILLERERYQNSFLQEKTQELERNKNLSLNVLGTQYRAIGQLQQQLLHERSKNENVNILLERERQQNSFLQEKTQELYGSLTSAQQQCLESMEHIEVLEKKETKLKEELLRKEQLNKLQIQQFQIKLGQQVRLNEFFKKENETLTSQLVDTNGKIAKIKQENQNETERITEHLSLLDAEIVSYQKEKLEFKKVLGSVEVLRSFLDEIKQATEKTNAKLERLSVCIKNHQQRDRRERQSRKRFVGRIWDELFSRNKKGRKGMEKKNETVMTDPEYGTHTNMDTAHMVIADPEYGTHMNMDTDLKMDTAHMDMMETNQDTNKGRPKKGYKLLGHKIYI